MKLLSRCPHCHQTEALNAGTDAQSEHTCPSCGLGYVPQRHMFVADELTDVTIAVRDDPVPPHPPAKAARPSRRAQTPPSRPLNPRQRLAWGLIALSLAVLGLAQVAVHQRDLWAAQWPYAQPMISALCRIAACRVAAPELIDAVNVVSSGFDQQDDGDFVFSLQIQHDRDHAVATPSVELTLTDAQDRAVLRKVLIPDQLGLAHALPPGAGLTTETRFSLDPQLQGHVSGFRVELFYP